MVYRPGCIEHYIVHQYRCREDFVPELDFIMEKDGVIIGHIMYVNAEILSDKRTKDTDYDIWSPLVLHRNINEKDMVKHCLIFLWKKPKHLG